MAKLNTKPRAPLRTHEGAPAKSVSTLAQLRRSLMSCMLWEDEFYESGEEIAKRIKKLVVESNLSLEVLHDLAVEARHQMKLRHAPLLVAAGMAEKASDNPSDQNFWVASTLQSIILRPDELTEFLAIYWKNGKCPLSGQVKKGLGRAYAKFSEYQLAKYNRDGQVKLKDVMYLAHPKPTSLMQSKLYKKVLEDKLETPDTWEVALSAGKDKKATFTRLIKEGKLGALALLRNLRNMREANVDQKLVAEAIRQADVQHVLPFRFIAAARFAPDLESALEYAMFKGLEHRRAMDGQTLVLVDVSGSMAHPISAKSDMTRMDAACGLAMVLRELCVDVKIRTFSNEYREIPSRRGFALRDAAVRSQPHSGTYLGEAIRKANTEGYDRIIVITDEQAADPVPPPLGALAYMINVASARNGVGYGKWTHIDGWSEAIVDYILEFERGGYDNG